MKDLSNLDAYAINFWHECPNLKHLEPFKTLYKKDRTKDKERSSKLMWAMYLVTSPKTDWYNIDDKFNKVKEDFLKTPELNWDDYEEHLEAVLDVMTSQLEKALIEADTSLRKRRIFLAEQEYSMGNAQDLDKLHVNSFKIYQDYDRIRKLVREEAMTDKDTSDHFDPI